MANEYEARIDIDTSGVDKGLKAVDKSVAGVDAKLKNLDGTLKRTQGTMSASAGAVQKVTKEQSAAALAANRLAQAELAAARARESASRTALNQARTEALLTRGREQAARATESSANSFQAVTGAVNGYSAGAMAATNANGALAGSMSNTRYLLYDIGATYRAISIGLLALPAATTAVAASFEKDFAQVERTTGGASTATAQLKGDIKDLAESIPLAFGDLTKITALGAQLGVATGDLSAFTEVVAKFSASTGVVAEEAGAAFGRIGSAFGLTAADYGKLGSAIAEVGVSSAATETEIIAITQQLAPLASLAGFSAQEVVGLSGALASMRIRPELARGAFQSTIFKITEATESGGKSLQAYADVMGITGDEVTKLFKTKPAEFFNQYITGIGKAMEGGQSFSSILDTLGVKEKRERQFILAMANQYGFLGEQFTLANKAYGEGTFLDKSSAAVFATLAAKLQLLGNSLANIGDSMGGESVKALAGFVELLSKGANGFADFVEHTPAMKELLGVLLGYGAIMGIFFAVRSAMAFVLAAMVGFQQVAGRAALTTTFSLKGIAAQAAVTRLVTQGATAQMAGDYVRTAGIIGAASARVVGANTAMGASIVRTGGAFKSFGAMAIGAVGGLPGIIVGALIAIGLGFMDAQAKAENSAKAIAEAMKIGGAEGLKATADALKEIKIEAGSGLEFGNLNKDLTEIASESGVGFDKLVSAVSKGKDGIAEFDRVVDAFAQSKGYKNLQDMAEKNPLKWTEGGQQVAKLDFLKKKVNELATENEKVSKSSDTADEAVKKLGGEGAEAMIELKEGANEGSSAFETLTNNIKDAVDQIFGLQNAESAAEASLYKLGQSLAESKDLTIGTEGGRDNLANAQTAVTKYAEALARARSEGAISAQGAAADYAAFIQQLYSEMVARGVDPAQAAAFMEQAKGVMGATAATNPVKVPVAVDGSQVATKTAEAVQGAQASVPPVVAQTDVDTSGVDAGAQRISEDLGSVTSQPWVAGVNADTSAGVENTGNLQNYLYGVTSENYVAPMSVDTSVGLANLQNLVNFAMSVINTIRTAMSVASGLTNPGNGRDTDDGGPVPKGPAAPKMAAAPKMPSIVPSLAPAQKGLGSLGQGYDDVANKANKAGGAGKKAGKDMADGAKDAADSVKDYADRLGTALTAAFDRQYGLAKATDEYHSALNAIQKKRDDELTQISDLIAKQKELNNARKGDLVDARKAQIEAEISQKYGEVDRAADYEQQAEEARLAAAEKQKNIDTAKKEQEELEKGRNALTGYSEAAIANRAALRDLESKMLQMITAYAATGASQEQVRAYAQRLTAQFQTDVGQIWNNRVAVNALTGEMTRYIQAINSVPRVKATTLTADTAGAMGQVSGLNGAIDWATRRREIPIDLNVQAYNRKMASIQAQIVGGGMADDPSLTAFRPGTFKPVMYMGGMVPGYASGGLLPGTPPSNPKADNLMAKVDGKQNIMVRSGEFIQPEPAVKYYGAGFMESIRNMSLPRYNVGGAVSGGNSASRPGSTGPMVVELTAENIAAIQRMPLVNLYVDAVKIAESVSNGNEILASQGAN